MVSLRKAHEKQLREKQEEFAKDMGRANQRSDERMQGLEIIKSRRLPWPALHLVQSISSHHPPGPTWRMGSRWM